MDLFNIFILVLKVLQSKNDNMRSESKLITIVNPFMIASFSIHCTFVDKNLDNWRVGLINFVDPVVTNPLEFHNRLVTGLASAHVKDAIVC